MSFSSHVSVFLFNYHINIRDLNARLWWMQRAFKLTLSCLSVMFSNLSQLLFGIQWAGVKEAICPTAAKGLPSFCLAKGSPMPRHSPDGGLGLPPYAFRGRPGPKSVHTHKMQLASGADLDIFPVIMLIICAYFYNIVWYWPMNILIFTLVIFIWVYPSGLWPPWGQGYPFHCPWADNWPRTTHCTAAQDPAACPWHLVISSHFILFPRPSGTDFVFWFSSCGS